MSHPLDHVPCGECQELVPRNTGCQHWHPDASAVRATKARQTRERLNRENKKPGPSTRRRMAASKESETP